MFAHKLRLSNTHLIKQFKFCGFTVPSRKVQISVIGAASPIGSNVSLLLKLNSKIQKLQLYDDDSKVQGIALELDNIPGGPTVSAFAGVQSLGDSLKGSHIVLMTARTARKSGRTREEMMSDNALPVHNLCKAMVQNSPTAFLAISTNPINCIIPFASALLCKFNCYNPCKVLGITHIDTARSRALVGHSLRIDSRAITVPVIGGHSDETIVPLFSNIAPSCHSLDPCHADTLTRMVRKAGTEIITQKQGSDSSVLAMAWSIHEFIDGLVDAVCGYESTLNCYSVNPHFGTRFFSGPTKIGRNGIICTCHDFPMNDYESYLLNTAVPLINRDVSTGEEHVRYISGYAKSW